jgi:hypothetical protein
MTSDDFTMTTEYPVLTRKRVSLILVIVTIGLPTRLFPQAMPDFMVRYGGDVLWAMMIFLLFGLLFPATKTWHRIGLALAVTWGIEFSQLVQSDWLNAIRSLKLGGLLIGYSFSWSDLACYVCGIGVGALLERRVLATSERINHED